jgi:23S rRNA pseudouridine1911/1915/1917 synthase
MISKLIVLYEDNHLIAAIKPPGVPSQKDESGDVCMDELVKAYLKEKYQKPGDVYLGLLHRIDRPVGGVMLFARTSKAAARMSEQFQGKRIQKKYLALTDGIPNEESRLLVHYLYKPGGKNIVKASPVEFPGAKRSELTYRVLEKGSASALLEVEPITGRQHQIRVQLATIGCPIRGDIKYGRTRANPDKSICLFAASLAFEHPVSKVPIFIRANIPQEDWWQMR